MAALAVLLLLLAGAPVAAHGGSVPARPTGLTAAGFHGGIALDHEIVSPYVRLDWDDPADTGITHYQVLRRDAGTHENRRFIIIDSDTGSAQLHYLDHAVEKNRRYVYRIVAVNDHGGKQALRVRQGRHIPGCNSAVARPGRRAAGGLTLARRSFERSG